MKQKIYDQRFMEEALKEAAKGLTTAHPNPRVGCVFVKDGEIVARGYHAKTGDLHAEVNAIKSATTSLEGSTCYVSLEPCAHYGRTPPCTAALIAQKIKRCVIACGDPFSKVNGRGIEHLIQAGVEIEIGVLQNKAYQLNQGFFKRTHENLPLVIAKVATSIDGKTSMETGQSQWITGEQAREDAHLLRAQVGAIITSSKTVNMDDAKLNVRHPCAQDANFTPPMRVILDSHLKVNPQSTLFTCPGKILICVGEHVTPETIAQFKQRVVGEVSIESFNIKDGHLDLNSILHRLANDEINEVLIEAGPRLMGNFLAEGLVDKIVHYVAPKIMGSLTFGMFDIPLGDLSHHIPLDIEEVKRIGQDIKIIAEVRALS